MVIPDFMLICEIMLVAEGFIDARLLARKFISLYTLCKELLSKQVNYSIFCQIAPVLVHAFRNTKTIVFIVLFFFLFFRIITIGAYVPSNPSSWSLDP